MNSETMASSPSTADDSGQSRPSPLKSPRVRLILLLVALALIGGGVLWFIRFETFGKYQESTNDAYIQADSITIAPKVSGYVDRVFVAENQDVKAGQPLAQIDPRDYRAQAAQSVAQIDLAKANAAGVVDLRHIGRRVVATDIDVLADQARAVMRVDAAFDRNEPVWRQRHVAAHQVVHRRLVDLAVRPDHPIHELPRRCCDVERTDVDDAAAAYDEAIGIGEIDVSADLPVLVGIEDAVDDGRAAADEVDEVAGAVRQHQIGGVAGADLEGGKRVEGVLTADRIGGDGAGTAGGRDRGGRAAVGHDVGHAGGNALGEGQRRRERHQHGEARRRHAHRRPVDEEPDR